jgi:L,D-peptidoglycan transpeptidase YkuD (ErfK/YbiS/YcfS/YnhG family)
MRAIVFPDGRLVARGEVFRAALGASGVRVVKAEGDGATPAGILLLRRVYYRADRGMAPVCAVPVEPIGPADGWCDDPGHRDYNRYVRLPHDGRCEELWRRDEVYDIVGVLAWNDSPVVRGRGSAIFLHVARPDYAPTAGCIALAPADLRRVLGMGVTELEVT